MQKRRFSHDRAQSESLMKSQFYMASQNTSQLDKCQINFQLTMLFGGKNNFKENQKEWTASDLIFSENQRFQEDSDGIRGKLLQWTTSSLEPGRSQQVLIEGQSSSSAPVTSGVPQGTDLGPLLFLIYINDLPSCVSSICRLFDDDSLLYHIIRSPEDQAKLQEDLDKLQEWERTG